MPEISPWLVVLIGVGTVFAGLVMLILAIRIMTLCVGAGRSKKNESAGAVENVPVQPVYTQPQMPHDKLVAVASAAIAEYIGDDNSGLRILSIKPVGGIAPVQMTDNRMRNVAIAAAIAEAIGTSPEGLRILSVKRV